MKLTFNSYLLFAQALANIHNTEIEVANESRVIDDKKLFADKFIRQRISFTPYIYNACSARCKFCSEGISRNDSSKNQYNSSANYFDKLQGILSRLKEIDIFLSLSGMEPFESLDFLKLVLATFESHIMNGGKVNTKVIYSNLSAMVEYSEEIIDLVKKYKIDRIETSRHHYDETKNQAIMNFRKGQAIHLNQHYMQAVKRLLAVLPLKMVCVVQQSGVNSVQEVEKYIAWCNANGVDDIVFRELSIINDTQFRENKVSDYINKHRVDIYSMLKALPSDFKLEKVVKGYYYLSFVYQYKNRTKVTFEVSDYEEMIRNHTSNTINKLIYYPNSDLCMDWNMEQKIE